MEVVPIVAGHRRDFVRLAEIALTNAALDASAESRAWIKAYQFLPSIRKRGWMPRLHLIRSLLWVLLPINLRCCLLTQKWMIVRLRAFRVRSDALILLMNVKLADSHKWHHNTPEEDLDVEPNCESFENERISIFKPTVEVI